ncbi:glycosyltransferase family 4 protein [Diaminobutyricimonas sp. LJ205]|uniref:MraY family glycosyltransferase n=1 Tax=Diaminobutyricimonas sp. LJ205 TaxID=2683590 RepID=UPI0012F48002|nr:glycosyltransferase family 4 protein [Diaminobutyricimonas sp. LJ205]
MSPVVILLIVLFLSMTLPGVVRPLLQRRHMLDIPNARSSHVQPALRGGGIAPLIAFTIGLVLFTVASPAPIETGTLAVCLGVAAASGIVGWIEDVKGASVRVRATAQATIGLAGSAILIGMSDLTWLLLPIFALSIAAYINVANFMDGINGISTLHAAVVGGTYAVLGLLTSSLWLTAAGAVLALAFIGFLPWNLLPRRMFLGDVGSYLLGGSISALAVAALSHGLPFIAVASPLLLYIADTGITLVRRVANGERWHEAHRTHIYQRLTDIGLSHLQTAGIVSAGAVCLSGLGLGTVIFPDVAPLLIASQALLLLAYVALGSVLGRRVREIAGARRTGE